MSETIRWGILGAGRIAHQFARGLGALGDAELAAVGSRTQENANRFGDKFGIPTRHGSYEALAADPAIDAIYVATPHPMHWENSILCLRAGKAVLCEKPFTVNKAQAEEVVRVAREEQRFCMEAMWTRFLPVIRRAMEWVQVGRIGEPRMVQADFGFRTDVDEDSRIFAPEFAGGGLLDVGVYALSFASMVFGRQPVEVKSLAHLGETRVDDQNAIVLKYDQGELALLSSAIRTNTPQEARIMGTEGMIHVHAPFWRGDRASLTVGEKKPEEVLVPYEGNGYNCEAAVVGECLRAGKIESELMPLDESVAIMETMDRIRAEWGLSYPME